VLKWKPLFWAEEQGQITSGVGPFLTCVFQAIVITDSRRT
jgi:hypothetical protein